MADTVRIQPRSLALSTGEAVREGWVARLIDEVRRARRRKLETFVRLHPKGASSDSTANSCYADGVLHGRGFL